MRMRQIYKHRLQLWLKRGYSHKFKLNSKLKLEPVRHKVTIMVLINHISLPFLVLPVSTRSEHISKKTQISQMLQNKRLMIITKLNIKLSKLNTKNTNIQSRNKRTSTICKQQSCNNSMIITRTSLTRNERKEQKRLIKRSKYVQRQTRHILLEIRPLFLNLGLMMAQWIKTTRRGSSHK